MKIRVLILLSVMAIGCKKENKTEATQVNPKDSVLVSQKQKTEIKESDTIAISTKHKPTKLYVT